MIDGDGENGIGIREGRQTSKAQLHALVAITSAVGYVAWHAYDKAGRIDMSECTCEVGEHTLTDLVRFALMSGAVDEAALVRALVIARRLPQGA